MKLADTVGLVLTRKATDTIWYVTPEQSVFEAIEKMAEKGIGALLVMSEGKLVGILSERDYARKVILLARSSKDTPVHAIMTSSVMYVRFDNTTEECMRLMTENRLRHLPVMDGARLVGLVSIGDLVKDIISEQQFIIEQLEHYITGGR